MLKRLISLSLVVSFSMCSVSQAFSTPHTGAVLSGRLANLPLNSSLKEAYQTIFKGLTQEEIDLYFSSLSQSDLDAAQWSLDQLEQSGKTRELTVQDAMVASIANRQYADGGATLFAAAVIILLIYKWWDAP